MYIFNVDLNLERKLKGHKKYHSKEVKTQTFYRLFSAHLAITIFPSCRNKHFSTISSNYH